ncbi:MerR family transcriptional regulator [Actinotalea fermentans]|uniref:MerR family transcriptional regulator n=1 Tax=Actinotalea fermentans TaxID=43671 RepID=A0A511YVX3_9CELL|nr:MerR family transcriptional regulator [Actinotalea fermentans]GEN79351.1 MerR family transcriptional regulator [Actinotalea fermentans]
MYTIKHAAELTGVPVATLRAWERRYAVVAPERTEGGYRLYDDAAVDRLRAMRDLVAAGWAPRQAADEVRGPRRRPLPTPPGERVDAAGPPPVPVPAGGPAVVEGAADLVAAGRALDAASVAAVLDERFARGSFESVVDDWLMPALRLVGDAWERGEVSTAAEHLVAHAVLRRLAAAFEAAAAGTRGPRVVIGLPPGGRHELGALAFAVAARRAGLAVTYVGADLPQDSWLDAVGQTRPHALVLAVPRPEDVPAAARVIDAVRRAHPDLRVLVGGGAQDSPDLPAPALGHRIGDAADRLAHALAGASAG